MSSRKLSRITAVAVALSIGALSLPSAEAAPARGSQDNLRTVIQKTLDVRNLQSIFELWRVVLQAKDQAPPGPDNQSPSREGSGLCPNGRPRGLDPSNGH